MLKHSRDSRAARDLLVQYLAAHVDPKDDATRLKIQAALDTLFDEILAQSADAMLAYVDNAYDMIQERITLLAERANTLSGIDDSSEQKTAKCGAAKHLTEKSCP